MTGRITREDIEWIKQNVCVVSLIESSGVKLKKEGRNYKGHCPFHDDKTPSLIITPSKNLWHCMGACQKGGSQIDWEMNLKGIDIIPAAEFLLKTYSNGRNGNGLKEKAEGRGQKAEKAKTLQLSTLSPDQQNLINRVTDYYHTALKKSPEALAYLEKRGIKNSEAIETFKLGYANRTLGCHLAKNSRSKDRETLKAIGILRQKTGHEHFNGCLTIPIIDEQENVQEIYGRKILHSFKQDVVDHLYLPGPHKGVWNIQALKESKEIILCESLIDALTFWNAGYKNVTSSYGIKGFTLDHLEAFKGYKTKRVLIAYDRDEGGERAALFLSKKLIAEGIETNRIHFPKNMDANEYASIVKPAAKSLGLLIDSALQRSLSYLAAKEKGNQPMTDNRQPITDFDIPTTIKGEDIEMILGERLYRIRGLTKNLSSDSMRINIRISMDDKYHIDTLDLYNARHRTTYINSAAKEVNVKADIIKRDIGRILLRLERLQEEQIKKTLEPKKEEIIISHEDKKEALELLKSPDLLGRILSGFEQCGLIGEKTNTLVGYLASISRKLDDPLAVLVQSSSSAGKSSLMDAILNFTPPEEKVKFTAMTGQSLFYMDKNALVHKVLAISEEEGAERARYAIKTMQSEKSLSIASTGKDPQTGRLITIEYRVDGPVHILFSTTAAELDEELQNRCIILTVNEGRLQTQAIHRFQRKMETLEGLIIKQEREYIIQLHQNAQRLLRPLEVINPYADRLTFLDNKLRTRRNHKKYLILIRSIALLHQYQRPIKKREYKGKVSEYIEVTLKDIQVANRLANEVLGRSLDELAPQTRRLLEQTTEMVRQYCKKNKVEQSDYRFTRKDIRNYTGWGNTQLKVHLHRLEEMEYLLIHRGERGQSYVYELLYKGEGKNGTPFVLSLLNVEQLNKKSKKL